MACFDPERREVVLRIVYDGPATAGKTANLRALHAAATSRALGGVVVPAETATGRTLYFDWLELLTGVVDTWPVRCQVLSVPGQLAFAERRFRLLREADAVVLVCDSTPAGGRPAKTAWTFLSSSLRALQITETPVLVQANKQDREGAVPVSELRALLGVREGVPVIPAAATAQEGVLETFLRALREARERVRGILRGGGTGALPQVTLTAEQLYRAMLSDEESGVEDPALAGVVETALDEVDRG
ncbi:MAG: GTPase domain-containing protein [Polyangiaceae bacterium]